MLTFSIDSPLFVRFPRLAVAAFAATHLDRAAANIRRDELEAEWRAAASELARRGITLDTVGNAPPIREWREAFAACGLGPPAYTASVEAAVRGALEHGGIFTRVPIVTLCSAISARWLAPLRGYDIDALPTSAVMLRASRPASDWFLPLGARPTEIPLEPGVVVYGAGSSVLCWSFNHRDSRHASLADDTTRAVFLTEAVSGPQVEAAAAALDELRWLLIERGAVAGASMIADAHTPSITVRFPDDSRRS
jgi:DNA/RNA-binding domain of Phe-tRNA-synthetase-like protein